MQFLILSILYHTMAINPPSFACPKSQLWLQRGVLDKHWASLERRVRDHPFNHAVEVFLPGSTSLPTALPSSPSSPPPYFTARLPLGHFLEPHLLGRYFSAGREPPTALSIGRRVDMDNVYALTPSGKLILSVEKDLYEQLGIPGKPSRYTKHRYVLEVDLTAAAFRPGRPGYERIKRCFATIPELQADFVLSWNNTDGEAQKQFMVDFQATKCENLTEEFHLTNLSYPVIKGDVPHGCHDNGEVLTCSAEELHTWLGAMGCGLVGAGPEGYIDAGSPGDYVSTFEPPHPLTHGKHGTRTRWSGMVTSEYICSILRDIRKYLSGQVTNTPWAAVSVWGFEDAPVSWRTNEHGWFQSGDNHYQIVLFRTGQFWMISTLGTYDMQL